jgi:PAT family beta-lactamase induction signal transducer AmpG
MSRAPFEALESKAPSASRNPWAWVPTLYFAQGLPYVAVNMISVIMYKSLGLSNTDIALYTSWLNWPWVIKPLWSPVVDILKTRRQWIWVMQLIIGAGMAAVALSIPAPRFFQYTMAVLSLLAFSSATHDIAADGFYMLATTEKEQAFFVGIRSTFFRLSMISGQGLLVILAGLIQTHTGLTQIDLAVHAKPGAPTHTFSTNQITSINAESGSLRLTVTPIAIDINPGPRPRDEVAAITTAARQWNREHHFNRVAEATKTADTKPSLWKQHISGPLADFLRRHFGRGSPAKSDYAGNVGVFYVQLNRPPDKEMTVTIAFGSGDKSISLAEGARLIFDDKNWNTPAIGVVQLDPALKTESSALFQVRSGNIKLSWIVVFLLLASLFLIAGIYHRFILPRPERDRPGETATVLAFVKEFLRTFGAFFRKPRIAILLLFLLFYRFAEAQLVKLVAPFLLDARETGGLGLTTGQVGFAYGTVGVVALTCGGLLGGMLVSRKGLKFWLWPMVLIMHLPDAAFVYLAYVQPANFAAINVCVALEQFGYGFGFTAYLLYMIYIARGKHETAHYAICTGFMALGMMLPGMFSGWLQDLIGYQHFFVWVMLATIPGFLVAAFAPLDAEFGRKT